MFHIRALRNINTSVRNQQMQTDKIYLSHIIRRHVSVAAAAIIRVSLKNANNVQRLHKMQKEIKE